MKVHPTGETLKQTNINQCSIHVKFFDIVDRQKKAIQTKHDMSSKISHLVVVLIAIHSKIRHNLSSAGAPSDVCVADCIILGNIITRESRLEDTEMDVLMEGEHCYHSDMSLYIKQGTDSNDIEYLSRLSVFPGVGSDSYIWIQLTYFGIQIVEMYCSVPWTAVYIGDTNGKFFNCDHIDTFVSSSNSTNVWLFGENKLELTESDYATVGAFEFVDCVGAQFTCNDSYQPSLMPIVIPTELPTIPTTPPTRSPTNLPTPSTDLPTKLPIKSPTILPTQAIQPPTKLPSELPATEVTQPPTRLPTLLPTILPTDLPTQPPTKLSTEHPTELHGGLSSVEFVTSKKQQNS